MAALRSILRTVLGFTLGVKHLLPIVVVDLGGGGRVYLQVTDFAEDEIGIGREVVLTFRRLHEGWGKPQLLLEGRSRALRERAMQAEVATTG